MKLSPRHLAAALILLAIEVSIASFARGGFIRGFLGDVLVVALIYCVVRAFAPWPPRPVAWGVLILALSIEVLQYFDYVALLGLENNRLLSIALGRTFSWEDFAAYLTGFGLCRAVER